MLVTVTLVKQKNGDSFQLCVKDCHIGVSCTSVVYFSCFGSILFASICLSHLEPYQSYASNMWLKYYCFLKGRGCALCAELHYRPGITLKVWYIVQVTHHFKSEEDWEKMELNEPGGRNEIDWITGSRWSLQGYILTYSRLNHLGPHLPEPLCTAGWHPLHRMGSLTQCPINFVQIFSKVSVCRWYNRLSYIGKNTVLLWKQTSHHLWKQVHTKLPPQKTAFI